MTNPVSFYLARIMSAPDYSFKSGHEILASVIRAAYIDTGLTVDEYNHIINSCQQAHIKMMEDNYNGGWNDEIYTEG